MAKKAGEFSPHESGRFEEEAEEEGPKGENFIEAPWDSKNKKRTQKEGRKR